MPKKGGLDVLRDLQAGGSPPPTILLTTFDDDEVLLEGVKAGARGYLLKDVSLEQLTEAIRTVAQGGTLIRPAVTERVLRGLEHVRRDFDALSPPDPLTRREVEILRLMAGGYSNREIADVARHRRGHDQEPRLQHPLEARRPRPHARGPQSARARLHLTRATGSATATNHGDSRHGGQDSRSLVSVSPCLRGPWQ